MARLLIVVLGMVALLGVTLVVSTGPAEAVVGEIDPGPRRFECQPGQGCGPFLCTGVPRCGTVCIEFRCTNCVNGRCEGDSWESKAVGNEFIFAYREGWHDRVYPTLVEFGIINREDWYQGCLPYSPP